MPAAIAVFFVVTGLVLAGYAGATKLPDAGALPR